MSGVCAPRRSRRLRAVLERTAEGCALVWSGPEHTAEGCALGCLVRSTQPKAVCWSGGPRSAQPAQDPLPPPSRTAGTPSPRAALARLRQPRAAPEAAVAARHPLRCRSSSTNGADDRSASREPSMHGWCRPTQSRPPRGQIMSSSPVSRGGTRCTLQIGSRRMQPTNFQRPRSCGAPILLVGDRQLSCKLGAATASHGYGADDRRRHPVLDPSRPTAGTA